MMVRIIQGSSLRNRLHFLGLQNVHTDNETYLPSCSMGTGILLQGLMRPGRDVNHALPPIADVQNEWSYTSVPPICLHGLGKENVTFLSLPLPRRNPDNSHMNLVATLHTYLTI
jgi:hypothetical protein